MKPKVPNALCASCPLRMKPFVPSQGPETAPLVLVGEAPGAAEVRFGRPFIGPSGELVEAALEFAGIERDDIFITNVCLCRPDGNADPPAQAIECCKPRLEAEIKQRIPDVIVTLGAFAGKTILQRTKFAVTKERGIMQYSELYGCDVMPTVHPAYLLRGYGNAKDLAEDFKNAIRTGDEHEYDYTLVTSVAGLSLCLDKLDTASYICYDLETSSIKPQDGYIITLNLSGSDQHAWVIPWYVLEDEGAVELLNDFFYRGDCYFIGQNLKFDNKWLLQYGIEPPEDYYDTMLMHVLIDERTGRQNRGLHGLKQMCMRILGVPDWEADINQYKSTGVGKKYEDLLPAMRQLVKQHRDPDLLNKVLLDFAQDNGMRRSTAPFISYAQLPSQVLYKYGAGDVVYNRKLFFVLSDELKTIGLFHLYRSFQQPVSVLLTNLEHRGFMVNRLLLNNVTEELETTQQRYLEELREHAKDEQLNPNSTQQLRKLLYDDLGLPVLKYTDAGAPSTDADTLEQLGQRFDTPVLNLLLAYRSVTKVLTSYMYTIADNVRGTYLHPDFFQFGTVTGRLAEMWLTIPSAGKNPYTFRIRDLMMARPGYVVGAFDYDQAELRVVTCEARETVFRDVFVNGDDPHSATADAIYGTSWRKLPEHIAKDKRRDAKTINFAALYGAGAKQIARQAKIDIDAAQHMLHTFTTTYKHIANWKQSIYEFVQRNGYVDSHFGFRRRYPLINRENWPDIQREAGNFPIQATANGLNLMAAVTVTQQLHDVHPLLMVHDSIILEIPEDVAEERSQQIKAIMQQVPLDMYSDYVPFTVDGGYGSSWGDAERSDKDET